jgi:enoyl-CoA hydratase
MYLPAKAFSLPVITLNRPKALNALCSPLFKELNEALSNYDNDKSIGAIIITGPVVY